MQHDDGGVQFTDVSFTPPSRVSETPRQVLRNISLCVEAGSTTALLGRSGSGKTTLLRTVNGLVLPTAGEVAVLGTVVSLSTPAADLHTLRRGIGYVIQETGLFPHMTVARNVALPLELAGVAKAERERKAAELLETVGLPAAKFGSRYPYQISGGQRQRAGVARALSTMPKILLLDEPFGALDPLTRAEMQAMLRDLLQRFGTTALMVTHDLDEALFLADRVLFVQDGAIQADLRAAEVPHATDAHVQEYVRAVHRFGEGGSQ